MKTYTFTLFGREFGIRFVEDYSVHDQPYWGFSHGILYCGNVDFFLGHKSYL